MIKCLRLENFGRFREQTFTFAPITVFSGNNETGKTTLFDAILDAVSSPKANAEYGKILVRRYGKDRKVSPEYDGEPLVIADKDFMNLFAVRSGTINLEIEENSQWMNQVKASLFSGGIDPGSIVSELEEFIKSKKQGSLSGEAKTITAELENLEAEKEKNEALRQKCFEDEKRITGAEDRMAKTREKISQLEAAQGELEKSLRQQNLLREEKTLKETLSNISEGKRKKDELDKYSCFDPVVLGNLKKLETEVRRFNTEAEKAAALEEDARHALAGCTGEKARYEAEKSQGDPVRILAGLLRDNILQQEKLNSTKTRRIWRKPFLIAAGLFLIAGIVVFFLTSYGWGILAAALGAACVCIAIAPKLQSWEDKSALDEALRAAREKWKKETGEDPGPDYGDVLAAFDRAAEKSRAVAEGYARVAARYAELEQKVNALALQKKQANDSADAAQRQSRSLLEGAGTSDIEDYIAHLETKKNTLERVRELDEKLKNILTEYSAASHSELEDTINRKISEISGSITEEELKAPELRVKENLLRETKRDLEVMRREEIENLGSFNKELGTIGERLRGLPEKIAGCEKGLLDRKARLAEIDRQLRAAKIAQELFASIAEDSSLMLEGLSGEIGALFSSITNPDARTNADAGTEARRTVSMGNFSMANVSVEDAQGASRDSGFLSAGTRDAFLLAARLVLARKSISGARAIIVLDEPFLALDRQRTERALSILKEFRTATLWQLVLFTKDEETVNQARAVFGSDLCVHELG